MLIRVSARFQKLYGCTLNMRDAPTQPFPRTWNVDILPHGRGQWMILASEEVTLYSILIGVSHTRHIDSFQKPFKERLASLFENNPTHQAPDTMQIEFSNRVNRSVIGSQNDMLFLLTRCLKDAGSPVALETLQPIEAYLNKTPMSYLKMDSPVKAFLERMTK